MNIFGSTSEAYALVSAVSWCVHVVPAAPTIEISALWMSPTQPLTISVVILPTR